MIVTWIRHAANASSTGPVLALQERMGVEGIGLYWMLFEAFLRTRGARRIDDRLTRSLAFELRVEQEPIAEFLRVAVEVGILSERDGHLVFEEVASEIERSEQVAKIKRGAALTRWSGGDAPAMHLHSTETRACTVDKIREERREKKKEKEDLPSLPPLDLTQAEKKSLLEQMTADELAYWERAVGLYRLRRPETARDNPWAAIQNWRERAISEGGTWNPEKKTYLKRGTAPPDDRASERAKILELKKRYEEEEKRALKK